MGPWWAPIRNDLEPQDHPSSGVERRASPDPNLPTPAHIVHSADTPIGWTATPVSRAVRLAQPLRDHGYLVLNHQRGCVSAAGNLDHRGLRPAAAHLLGDLGADQG